MVAYRYYYYHICRFISILKMTKFRGQLCIRDVFLSVSRVLRHCCNARCSSGLHRNQLDGICREQVLLNKGKGREWRPSDPEKQVAPELCLGSLHQPSCRAPDKAPAGVCPGLGSWKLGTSVQTAQMLGREPCSSPSFSWQGCDGAQVNTRRDPRLNRKWQRMREIRGFSK